MEHKKSPRPTNTAAAATNSRIVISLPDRTMSESQHGGLRRRHQEVGTMRNALLRRKTYHGHSCEMDRAPLAPRVLCGCDNDTLVS